MGRQRAVKQDSEVVMSDEEKYKLALFAVIRNSTVMPKGMQIGASLAEIDRMSVETMECVIEMCDFERLKKHYENALN